MINQYQSKPTSWKHALSGRLHHYVVLREAVISSVLYR
jgi:hypothetical protein